MTHRTLHDLRAAAGETVRSARSLPNLRAGRNDWYKIENDASGNSANVYIYDEIGYFGVTAQDFVNDLKTANYDLTVHINSPGGNVFDGIAILNALRAHKGTVTTVVDGIAASAASFIAQAGQKRIMARNSQMMIHDASGMCIGNASDARELADLLDKASDNIADVYASRSGRGTAADWRAAMSAETWYSDDEAVAAGLADYVEGKEAETTNSWDLSIYAHAGRRAAPEPTILPEVVERSTTPEQHEPPARPWDLAAFLEGLKNGA